MLKDDHQHSVCSPGAAGCHTDHALLLLSNTRQCEVNPRGLSLGGLIKEGRERVKIAVDWLFRVIYFPCYPYRRQHSASLLLLPDESEYSDCEDKCLHLHRPQCGRQRWVCIKSTLLVFLFNLENSQCFYLENGVFPTMI